jgi:hypothetical protein
MFLLVPFSKFWCTSHQPILVVDVDWRVSHVKRLMARWLQNLCPFLNFDLLGTATRQPPSPFWVCPCVWYLNINSFSSGTTPWHGIVYHVFCLGAGLPVKINVMLRNAALLWVVHLSDLQWGIPVVFSIINKIYKFTV